MNQSKTNMNRLLRKRRIRAKVRGTTERPRLHVYRSNKHVYTQVIDDVTGKTLASAHDAEVKVAGTKTEKAREVGSLVAERALQAKVKKVQFDRGEYMYHGRVKAIAEAARKAGLEF